MEMKQHSQGRILETELKKGMMRSILPFGLAIVAIGLYMTVSIGSYLMKYFRGAVPLQEAYQAEKIKEEYVSLDIDYVLGAFMESSRIRNGVSSKSSIYYLVLDEEAGPAAVRVSPKMEEEMDRIMDQTWDYLTGVRPDVPQGIHVEGTMKKLKGDGKTYYDRALSGYEMKSEDDSYYLWAGHLDNQSPSSAMGMTGFGALIILAGLLVLSRLRGKKHIKAVQEFLDTHSTISRETLDEDFQTAQKLSNTFWMGNHFTYGISGGKPVILVNQELKRIWFKVERIGRGTTEELVFTMDNEKEHKFDMKQKKANEIIALYQEKYPSLKMSIKLRQILPEDEETKE